MTSQMLGSTMVAYLHGGSVAHNFMHSVLATMLCPDNPPYEIVPVRSGPNLFASRNAVAAKFLASEHTWLWTVDSDMGFHGNTLRNLHNAADADERPIVGALCFAQLEEEPDGLGGWRPVCFPTLYRRADSGGYRAMTRYPDDALVRVDGTGAACLLIHRRVFERWRVRDADGVGMYSPLGALGEDLAFCVRATEIGFPIHVHTGIPTSHQKPTWLRANN